jgi:class 3 adenylate cyclase
MKNYASAREENEKDGGNKNWLANNYGGIGNVYSKQGNDPEALKNFLTSLKINDEIGNKFGIAHSYENIGWVLIKLNRAVEAKEWLQKALVLNNEIGAKGQIPFNYYNLADADSALGNYKSAYENYKMYVLYKDSVFSEENTRKLTHAAMQFEFDKKETELKYQQQLTAGQLEKQHLLNKQQQQSLLLSNKEKDLQHLAYLKEKAEKQEKEKQLVLSEREKELQSTRLTTIEKEKLLQTSQLQTQQQEIATKNAQRNLFIAGTVLFLLLASSVFLGLKRTTKEKKKSDSLLHNILPAEVAEELKAKGSTTARQYNDVSILFTDFVNFTQTSETLSPEELVHELNTCFTAFDEITGKYEIEKIKTIGDAYLAVCGLPNADPKHAQNVVHAALEIRDFIGARKQQLGDHAFDIRIGIHSGSVVAGIVGVKKFAYDIWGDTVNTAARMESSGEAGKVNISETTYGLVKDEFTCTHRGKITAKGKGEIDMYFVTHRT